MTGVSDPPEAEKLTPLSFSASRHPERAQRVEGFGGIQYTPRT
jgi:hypothetical protein